MAEENKNPMPVLEVKHLVKFFGEREILKDIDFQVFQGDVISIIGASARILPFIEQKLVWFFNSLIYLII